MLPFAMCSVVEGVALLQAHVERLFLLVLLRQLPAGGVPAGGGGDVVGTQGVAFLAALFSLGWAVRREGAGAAGMGVRA